MMERLIEVLEMRLYRRLLKIPWVDHISREQVLQRVDDKWEIVTSIRQRQLRFLGHTMREDQLESLALRGKSRDREGEDTRGLNLWIVWQDVAVVAYRRRRCCG